MKVIGCYCKKKILYATVVGVVGWLVVLGLAAL